MSDIFVLLDDVQHSREFENRNYIKTPQGKKWLTIPCKGKSSRVKINQLKIFDPNWIEEHKIAIELNYKKSKYYSKDILEKLYDIDVDTNSFFAVIHKYLENCLKLFEIETNLVLSSSLDITSVKAQKLADICSKLGATTYISGINGKSYIKDEFKNVNIDVNYHQYDYSKYEQLWGEFIPWMGFIDMLFNIGLKETEKSIKICLKKE